MMQNESTFRLPAEWEPQEMVLLSWPHPETDWLYMLEPAQNCFLEIAKAISRYAKVLIVAPDIASVMNQLRLSITDSELLGKFRFVEMQTNDTWARDFGPICVVDYEGKAIANDFKFNGWGLKFPACYDNLITTNICSKHLHKDAGYRNRLNFVLEGGSIDSDGEGSLLTTEECLLSPNRNGEFDRDEITNCLKEFFNCKQVIWLESGFLLGDDTDSHVDTLARFLPGNMIAYSACDRKDDVHYDELKQMEHELKQARNLKGEAYRLLPLPIPMPIYDESGERLPATYANFLIINGAVLLPTYYDKHYDSIAEETLRAALPDYEIVPINCRPLIHQHGSLHCVTMQLPHSLLDI